MSQVGFFRVPNSPKSLNELNSVANSLSNSTDESIYRIVAINRGKFGKAESTIQDSKLMGFITGRLLFEKISKPQVRAKQD